MPHTDDFTLNRGYWQSVAMLSTPRAGDAHTEAVSIIHALPNGMRA